MKYFTKRWTFFAVWSLFILIKGYDICFDFNQKLGQIDFNKIEEEEGFMDEDDQEKKQPENQKYKIKIEEDLKDFYYATCKSTRAYFFPALFSTG